MHAHLVVLKPGVSLDHALVQVEGKHLRHWHLPFRKVPERVHIEKRQNRCIRITEYLQHPLAYFLHIDRILHQGEPAVLAAASYIIRQNPAESLTQYALLHLANGFHLPGDIPHIFHQAIITVRHARLKTDGHTDAIFAIKHEW